MPPPTCTPWRVLALRPAPTAASTTATTTPRLFHTTRALAGPTDEVPTPPESPNFFSLPTLLQSDETKRPPVKGRLPVPRAIFSKRAHGAHKISPGFVRKTAALSAAELAGKPPKSDKDAWKRVMAASRRAALEEGVGNLWQRKKTRDRTAKQYSVKKQRWHAKMAAAPPPADEVHTRSTVTQATLKTVVIRDPLYAQRQRESLARTRAIEAAKVESRKDAVQRLYVQASYFILDEADLAARIERIFKPEYFKDGGLNSMAFSGGKNVWQKHGPPKSIRDFVAELDNGSRDQGAKSVLLTTKRQRTLTGELTGPVLSVLEPTFFAKKTRAPSGVA